MSSKEVTDRLTPSDLKRPLSGKGECTGPGAYLPPPQSMYCIFQGYPLTFRPDTKLIVGFALALGLLVTNARAQTSAAEVRSYSIPHEWIEVHARTRLQALVRKDGVEAIRITPYWRLGEGSRGELSEDERAEVIAQIDGDLSGQLTARPEPSLRLEVMVTEVWRPMRMLNALLFAIPIPGSGPLLASRGGISIESTVFDHRTNAVLARLKCSQRAGLNSLAGLFGRVSDAKVAARQCTEQLVQSFVNGQPFKPALAATGPGMSEAGASSMSYPEGNSGAGQ